MYASKTKKISKKNLGTPTNGGSGVGGSFKSIYRVAGAATFRRLSEGISQPQQACKKK